MKLISAILAVWCISLGVSAGPNINIGTVFDYMDAGQSSYLKRIYNGGNSTAFVRVSILEIIYKADGTSEEVPLQAQGNSAVRDGLLACWYVVSDGVTVSGPFSTRAAAEVIATSETGKTTPHLTRH